MARRIGALLGIVVIIGLVLVLMWRVYIHHSAADLDEPAVVSLELNPSRGNSSPATAAINSNAIPQISGISKPAKLRASEPLNL